MHLSFMIILIGVSGAGKSALGSFVLRSDKFKLNRLIAVTNRPDRFNEKNGVDKIFLSSVDFHKFKNNGSLCMVNKRYGYSYAFFTENFKDGKTYIGEFYYKDYPSLIDYHSNCVNIYVRPETIEQAINGILSRGASMEENKVRIAKIKEEHEDLEALNSHHFFDYTFINKYDKKSMNKFFRLIKSVLATQGV